MKWDKIVEQVADKVGMPVEIVAIYLKSYLEAQRRSAAVFQPVKIHGKLSLNLHNYILKYKQLGKNLPMPEGINAVLNEDRTAHNYNRRAGTFLKVGNSIGVVLKQIGEEQIEYLELCKLQEYKFGKHERLLSVFGRAEQSVILNKEDYNRNGSVKAWHKRMGYKIDPPMPTTKFIKQLRKTWIE